MTLSAMSRGIAVAAVVGVTASMVGAGSTHATAAANATADTHATAGAQPAPTIGIDTRHEIGQLSQQLTGSNNDHWFDNSHGLWDPEADAPNPDVVERVTRAGVGMIRFPGGTPANLYNWKRAIGPQDQRGCQTDGRGNGGEGPHDSTYGPDEYLRFIEDTGATAEIMTPMINQTPGDAADWVEYLNAKAGTNPRGGVAWAAVRATNGHPAPYGVRYWEIGNEPDRGGQEYWRVANDPRKRLFQYVFGGRQVQRGQRLGRGCDRRPAASASTGAPSQQLDLSYPPAVPHSQTVHVDGAVWHPVRDLSTAPPNAQVYSFDSGTGRVSFGDGTHGAIPPAGMAITADYVSGPQPGFLDFYAEMKRADPSIDVCSSWAPIRESLGLGSASFPKLMAATGHADDYDCVVIHPYTNFAQDFGTDDWVSARDGHDEYMLGEQHAAELVAGLQGEVARYGATRPYVAVSEFGALWFGGLGQHPAYQHWETAMSHATYMASQWVHFAQLGLRWAEGNTLISEAPTGLRGVLGGPPTYVFTADAVAREQLAPVLAAGGTTVRTGIQDDPQIAPEQPKPGWGSYEGLSSSASVGRDGVLRVVVVSRHPTQAITAHVDPGGFTHRETVAVTTVAGAAFTDYNDIQHPDSLRVVDSTISPGAGGFDYAFPAASITVLELVPATRHPGDEKETE